MKKFFLYIALILPAAMEAQTWNLPSITSPKFKKDTLNIVKAGARPDGFTLNTNAINSSIEALSKKGGGVVLVPKGLWLTGPIVLQSNVNLHLANGSTLINLHLATGATLLFTKDKSQYPLITANWEGLPQMRNQSPISATGARNIAITGKGIIDGNGDEWRAVKKDKLTESQWKKKLASGGVVSDDKKTWYPSAGFMKGSKMPANPGMIMPGRDRAFYDSIKDFLRPNLLLLTQCKNILLEGYKKLFADADLENSPAWCLHPLMCEQLTVRNIFVKNPWYAQKWRWHRCRKL